MRDLKEHREKNFLRPFFLRDLFTVSLDGLSGRGTTRSLDQDGKDGESWKDGQEVEGNKGSPGWEWWQAKQRLRELQRAGDGKGGNTFWPRTTVAKIARVVRVPRMPSRVANAARVIVTSGWAWGEMRVPRVTKGDGGEDGGGKNARSCKSPELTI